MAHEIEAFVLAEPKGIDGWKSLAGVRYCRMSQGFLLLPVVWDTTSALRSPMGRNTETPFPEFCRLSNELVAFANEISILQPIAYIETSYFGGDGSQAAMVWSGGCPVYGPIRATQGVINEALRRIGVQTRPGADEFDALGLCDIRSVGDAVKRSADVTTS